MKTILLPIKLQRCFNFRLLFFGGALISLAIISVLGSGGNQTPDDSGGGRTVSVHGFRQQNTCLHVHRHLFQHVSAVCRVKTEQVRVFLALLLIWCTSVASCSQTCIGSAFSTLCHTAVGPPLTAAQRWAIVELQARCKQSEIL